MGTVSKRRFLITWTAVSIAIFILSDIAWDRGIKDLVNERLRGSQILEGYLFYFLFEALFAGLAAFAQSKILARFRRPIGPWVAAALVGRALSILLSFSVSEGLSPFIWTAPGVRTYSRWVYPLIQSATVTFCYSTCEAVAVWRCHWSTTVTLWIVGRVVIAVVGMAIGGLLTLRHTGLYPAFAEGRPFLDQATYFLENALPYAVSVAGTAWLLERLVFRRRLDEVNGAHHTAK